MRRAHPWLAIVPALLWGSCAPEPIATGSPHVLGLRYQRSLGEAGRSPGQFVAPRVMEFDGQGLWVIDKLARVQRLDPETGDCRFQFTMPEFELGKPVGMTTVRLSTGELQAWVADTHYHRVLVYRIPEDGGGAELVLTIGSLGEGPGQFIYPTDVAVLLTPDGRRVERIFVGEYGGNDRIQCFDGEGTFLFEFGELGESSLPDRIEFNRPQGLALDPVRRELVVADSCNHRIGRFSLEGVLVEWLGDASRPGAGACEFRYPFSISAAGDGEWWVCERGNNRVQRVDLVGRRSRGVLGRPGRAEGEFSSPWAACAAGNTLFVLDTGNSRIQVFGGRG